MENKVIVLDNGAFEIKAGFAGKRTPDKIMENVAIKTRKTRRLYIGDQFSEITSYAGLRYRRPHCRGYMANRFLQKAIWNHLFTSLNIEPTDYYLALSQPILNTEAIKNQMDEIIFETFGFKGVKRVSGPVAAIEGYDKNLEIEGAQFDKRACVVLDAGYSFTDTVAITNCIPDIPSLRRIELGGMHLTNKLKEIISFRQMDLRGDTHLADDMKHRLCYTAQNFIDELRASKGSKSKIRRKYVLPDDITIPFGTLQTPGVPVPKDKQFVVLNNERIALPEIFFNPSYFTDLNQAGIVESIADAIACQEKKYEPVYWGNILLVGGSVEFPGFKSRLHKELRAVAPSRFPVNIYMDDEPGLTIWKGLSSLASDSDFPTTCISKAVYEESGTSARRSKRRRGKE